jgi:hypothetical protein
MGGRDELDDLKTFTKSQEVWDAYRKYLELEDMTMVEFAEIVYPLTKSAHNRDTPEAKNPTHSKSKYREK